MADTSSELKELKTRLKETWKAGDFGQIAKFLEKEAEKFVARRNIKPGMRVLDVACGTGNVSIPAAKAGAIVIGVDIASNLLEQARKRAEGEGVKARFDEGDAEELPYRNEEFDLVLSMYGAMFAPRPELVASELVRVCRPGGQIVMANWTPSGFAGQMFNIGATYAPPSPGMPPPVLWGDEATVRERLRNGVSELTTTPVMATFKYPFSVPNTVEFLRLYFGPTQRFFASLPEEKQSLLRRDLEQHWTKNNMATDGTVEVEAEYLEVIATRALDK
jgi:ubiquinone/menaquinone biosynthesis C-methylase UbiE